MASSEGSNGSSDIVESEEELKDLPDYLRETTEEEELYNSDNAPVNVNPRSPQPGQRRGLGLIGWRK